MRLRACLIFICSIGLLSGCTIVRAQQRISEEKINPEDSVSSLAQDIKMVLKQQQQMMDQLNELKRLLPSNSAGRSAASELPATLGVHGELFRGDPKAPVAIIAYADFECPYCGAFERSAFPQILSDYIQTGKVKYFYRDLPLPMHPHAMSAARAARCAGEQNKYWEMYDSLFAKQSALSAPAILDRAENLGMDTAKFSECASSERYTEEIQKSTADARKIGIEGTPTFFLGTIGPNGDVVNVDKKFVGAAPYDVFKSEIDALLAKEP